MNPSEREADENNVMVNYSSSAVTDYLEKKANEVFPEYLVRRYATMITIWEVTTSQKEKGRIFKRIETVQLEEKVIRMDVSGEKLYADAHREDLYNRLEALLRKVGRKCKRKVSILKHYVEED